MAVPLNASGSNPDRVSQVPENGKQVSETLFGFKNFREICSPSGKFSLQVNNWDNGGFSLVMVKCRFLGPNA
jgi:hypothetical protein